MTGVVSKPVKKARALRYSSRKVRTVAHRTGNAAETIGRLAPGDRVTGVTAGQFSSIDALEHMVNELGPADVAISTWTTGLYDVARAAELRANRQLGSVRMLIDRGTFEKSPQFAGPLIKALGVDAFRCLSVHAKVTIVSGERGSAVMRSSMNLNKNLRTEQFDIDVCDVVSGFYSDWFEALWEESGRGLSNREIIEVVFDRFEAMDAGGDVPAGADSAADFDLGDLAGLSLDAGFDVADPGNGGGL